MDEIKKFFKELTIEKVIVKLVIAWLIVNILSFIKLGGEFNGPAYAASISLPIYACFVILIFVALCFLDKYKILTWVEIFSPMVLITIYGYLSIKVHGEVSYALGIAVFLAFAIAYAMGKSTKFYDIKSNKTVIAIYIMAAIFYTATIGSIAIIRYKAYISPNYDFGIWANMFYNMKKSFKPLSTCERQMEGLMSHFKVHFSPIYYLYLPFYMLFTSPATINFLQVLTIAGGIIPVYLLCREKKLSNSATALFSVIFVLFPAISCGTFYDLHENCFLVPLLLWLFYFIEKNNFKGILIFTILTLLVKEDAAIYTACVGLYMILAKKNNIRGVIVTIVSVVYFLVVTLLMSKYGLGIMDNRFTNYMVDSQNGGLFDVIKNFITNPVYVIKECFRTAKLEFIFFITFPVGLLSFVSKKAGALVLFIPILLENLVSNYKYQYSINFQYVFGTSAILIYLAIVNYSELTEKTRRFMAAFAICIGIVILPMCGLSKSHYYENYSYNKETYKLLDKTFEEIPKEASVAASTFFVPHLSNRDVIYEYDYEYEGKVDYIILDMRYNKYESSEIMNIKSEGYTVFDEKENLYIIFKSNIDF